MANKVWAVDFDGRRVSVQDLLAGDLQDVADEFGVSWAYVVDAPLYNLKAARRVVALAATKAGVDVPDGDIAYRDLQAFFVQVDDDVPEAVEVGDDGPLSSGDGDSTAG
jgi:hypothetical protein